MATEPVDLDVSPPRGDPFPIVGIGASAGGLSAFQQLLAALPGDTGMAFVLVQHLDPHHESTLPEILGSSTRMPVVAVADGMTVRPNHVYVIPPDFTMILEGGTLRLAPRPPGRHMPIDAFFESLAESQGGRAIAVVLSGSASDGSYGVLAVKAECGITFAQSEQTAQYPDMPRNAIGTGAVDYVLSPAQIAEELAHLGGHPYVRPPQADKDAGEVLPEGDGELKRIFKLLRVQQNVDFSHYKPRTVQRRIGRRMIVTRQNTLERYAKFLAEHPAETGELYRDLLVGVTHFFRDPETFAALQASLAGALRAHTGGEGFRAWVAGCATGEEAYSIAIILRELLDEQQSGRPLQIFGTDVNEASLDRARAGIYPDSIERDVSPERLRRYFVRTERGYQVSKSLREVCVFARHNLIADPPFAHTDLICCRNLLIYLDATLQRRVFPVLHYSLNPDGVLLLGSAETISAAGNLFTALDSRQRIYRRNPTPARFTLDFPFRGGAFRKQEEISDNRLTGAELERRTDRVIQQKYGPAAVVVDTDLQILSFRGRTGFFLESPPGEASLSLLRMARDELAAPLRRLTDAAKGHPGSVREEGITVEHGGQRREINLEVTSIRGGEESERYYLVIFEDGRDGAAAPAARAPAAEIDESTAALETQVREQQEQLKELREHLRYLNEDHEAHEEELRAANEEARSANEELQSTNEELNTAKEEIQSANEELITVNQELQTRNDELKVINSDLINFLSAVDVAFLITDGRHRIRRFSSAAEKLFGLRGMHVGQPLESIGGRIDVESLRQPIERSAETLSTEVLEIQDAGGRWFSVTIRPYRTVDHRIDGVVIVFADIDLLKRALRATEAERDYSEGIIETVREPLLTLDGELRVLRATPAFYETFRVSRQETEGRHFYELGNGQWNHPRLRELLTAALQGDAPFQDFELEHGFPLIGRRTMRLNARRIPESHTLLLAIEDITKSRTDAEARYRRLFEAAKDGMLLFDAETETLHDVNPYFLELTGYGREQLVGRPYMELDAFRECSADENLVAHAREHEIARRGNSVLHTRMRNRIETDIVANSYLWDGRLMVQLNVRDVTSRNKALRAMQESEERFRLLVDSVQDYAVFQMDQGGRIASWNSGAERLLGYTEEEIVGLPADRLFTPEDVAQREPLKERNTAQAHGRAESERWQVRKDGSRFMANSVLTVVRDEAGSIRGFARVMHDVTQRKQTEGRLKQQAELLELAQDAIIVRQLDGAITFWNKAAVQIYGWDKQEASGKIIHTLLKTKFPEPLEKIQASLLAEGRWEGELEHTRRDHTRVTVWSRWTLRSDRHGKPAAVLEIDADITRQKADQEKLLNSLREKEVLLKEIHHRVKNNLQIIASLLSMQSEHVDHPETQTMIEEMNNRVRSIAAIHETLYGSVDFSRIDFGAYLNRIAQDLTAVYQVPGGKVRLEVDPGSAFLEISQAVPAGLIVNELLTNSFKHAFPKDRSGVIRVSFTSSEGSFVLEIADNGVGMPERVSPQTATSMGLQLLSLLVQQLRGKVEIKRDGGTRFTIVFPRKEA